MEKCPYCANELIDNAVRCSYCGKWLDKKQEGLNTGQEIQIDEEKNSRQITGAGENKGMTEKGGETFLGKWIKGWKVWLTVACIFAAWAFLYFPMTMLIAFLGPGKELAYLIITAIYSWIVFPVIGYLILRSFWGEQGAYKAGGETLIGMWIKGWKVSLMIFCIYLSCILLFAFFVLGGIFLKVDPMLYFLLGGITQLIFAPVITYRIFKLFYGEQ